MPSGKSPFLKGTVGSTAALAVFYGVFEFVPVRPLVIPGYLLIVGFDLIEATFGSAGAVYVVLFALYLVGLGLVGGVVAHLCARASRHTQIPAWRLGVAAAFLVVSFLAFAFAAMVEAGTAQRDPVRIAGATGLVLLVLAAFIGDGPRLLSGLRSR